MFLLTVSVLDGLNRVNEPEKAYTAKKAEPQSHNDLLHHHMFTSLCNLIFAWFCSKLRYTRSFFDCFYRQ